MAPASSAARVLLVDDHRSVLWGLARLIESAGPALALAGCASSADEALAAAARERPDVVLLDLDLGGTEGGDGAGLVGQLRRAGARVIILTGATDPALQDRALMEGASGFVHKSETGETILKAITRVAGGELWVDQASMARAFSALCRPRPVLADAQDSLTRAELRVIAEVVRHKSKPNKVIAGALGISTHTLRNHLASIYHKLSLTRRLELVLYALERKLDRPSL